MTRERGAAGSINVVNDTDIACQPVPVHNPLCFRRLADANSWRAQDQRQVMAEHKPAVHTSQEAGHRPEGPFRRFAEHRLGPIELVGSTVIAPSDIQQFTLRIWQAAFRCDTSKPMRHLSVMLPILLRPTIPIGGDILQCERVFI